MNPETRTNWTTSLFTSDTWHPAPTPGNAGEAGGYFMVNDRTAQVAWMKPKRVDLNHAHAAKEKIAFDLSILCDINVPPVVLYHRENPPPGESPLACLSLVCYPKLYMWGDVFTLSSSNGGLLPHSQSSVEQALAAVSGTVAFDAWLGNDDRNNGNNALLGYETAGINPTGLGEFLFIDFSNTMTWSEPQAAFARLNVPPLFANALNQTRIKETITKIAAIDDAKIESIVNRIPDNYLQPTQKTRISAGLISRKARLLNDFSIWYPGTAPSV
ncbi:MAG: hypothetical protein JSS02_14315 [Planctomycetes bacterium]|nr:hypothetical protein [Planctomycetota bacterium]